MGFDPQTVRPPQRGSRGFLWQRARCGMHAHRPPLHRAGKAVVPLIIAELPNRAMPRRRYAIGFLGEEGYREALPVLEMIARNSAELEYVRGDALLAISEIDLSLARKVASGLTDATGHLGGIAKAVLQGGSTLSVLINRSCV